MENYHGDALDPMISRSLDKDYCKIIINFLNNQNKDLSFLNFKAYWKDMNFPLLHYLTLDKYDYTSYIQVIFHTILKLLSCQYYNYIDDYKNNLISVVNENNIREALWNMCVIYILHISYYTQISSDGNMIQIQIGPEYASCLLNASMSMNQIHYYGATAKKLYNTLIASNCFTYKSYSGPTSLLYCFLHLKNFEQRHEQLLNIVLHNDNEIPSIDQHINTNTYKTNIQEYLNPSKCCVYFNIANPWNAQNILSTEQTVHRILQQMLLINQNVTDNNNNMIENESIEENDVITIPNLKENDMNTSIVIDNNNNNNNMVHNKNDVTVNHLKESISSRRQEYMTRKINRLERIKNLESIRQNKVKRKNDQSSKLYNRKLKNECLYNHHILMDENRITMNKETFDDDIDIEEKQICVNKKTRQLYTTNQLEQIALMKPLSTLSETINNNTNALEYSINNNTNALKYPVNNNTNILEYSNDGYINGFQENSTLYSDFEEFVGIKTNSLNTNKTYVNPISILDNDVNIINNNINSNSNNNINNNSNNNSTNNSNNNINNNGITKIVLNRQEGSVEKYEDTNKKKNSIIKAKNFSKKTNSKRKSKHVIMNNTTKALVVPVDYELLDQTIEIYHTTNTTTTNSNNNEDSSSLKLLHLLESLERSSSSILKRKN